MDRRTYLAGIGTVAAVAVSGCSDTNEPTDSEQTDTGASATPTETAPSLITGSASTHILSVAEISTQLPGEWTQTDTRPPTSEPVGLESSEIKILSGETENDEVEHGLVVFDTIENAETFMGDEREEGIENQNVGDEAFSASDRGITVLLARERNVVVQEYGTPHISNFRVLAEEQIAVMNE
jgi:hypothetical protein